MILTELAFEKAERLGVKLVQPHALPPASPVRPYLSDPVKPVSECKTCSSSTPVAQTSELRQRIKDAVKAKLGDKVDGPLLDTIITRVLNNVGVEE